MINNERQRGFTLLISIVITATLLLISTGIISVAVKEAFLTSANRHSQEAFYAADSAIECVLFWDLKNTPNNTGMSAFSLTDGSSDISCNQQLFENVGGSSGETRFTIMYPPGRSCAEVYVRKRTVIQPRTLIQAFGYNDCDVTNPRRVQRAIGVGY